MTQSDNKPGWPPHGLTGWLVRWTLPGQGLPLDANGRMRVGVLQGSVSMAVNLGLFLVKAVLGLLLGSLALLADAVHSLSDVGSSLIVVLGFIWARKPRDSRHPFGHGRVELVTALVLAVLLIVLAVEFFRMGISRVIDPRVIEVPWWVIVTVVATMGVKQWIAIFAHRLAVATGSTALKADYWHHLADVLSTGLVVLALLASRWGWAAVDGWAALGVGGFILYTGFTTARHAIDPLLGEAPSRAEVTRIQQAGAAVSGVRGVHDLIMHKYGVDQVISLHIEVDADRSALELHDIAEQVEQAVEQAMGGKAIVHVDPIDRTHPQYEEAAGVMAAAVANHTQLTGYHDLRVQGSGDRLSLSVDVVTAMGTLESDYPVIERNVEERIRAGLKRVKHIEVTVETGYHEV